MSEVIELQRLALAVGGRGTCARSSRAATRRRAGSRARSGRRWRASRSRWRRGECVAILGQNGSGQVDARPPALDAAAARRRQRARSSATTSSREHARGPPARQPRLGRGELLQEDVGGREPRLRGALLRHDAARDARRDPRDPRARSASRADAARRADGEPLARHAAEGRARAGAAHVARCCCCSTSRRRGSTRARSSRCRSSSARCGRARRDDPALHARPRRGRGARRPRSGSSTAAELLFLEPCRRAQASASASRRSRRRSSPRPAATFEDGDGRGRRGAGGVRMMTRVASEHRATS